MDGRSVREDCCWTGRVRDGGRDTDRDTAPGTTTTRRLASRDYEVACTRPWGKDRTLTTDSVPGSPHSRRQRYPDDSCVVVTVGTRYLSSGLFVGGNLSKTHLSSPSSQTGPLYGSSGTTHSEGLIFPSDLSPVCVRPVPGSG